MKRRPLSVEERKQIYYSEVWHYKEYAALHKMSENNASSEVKSIKRMIEEKNGKLRPCGCGCINIHDLADYLGVTVSEMRAGI